jgi:cupin superfamily acireductone dioxygenase involved in methionine salvage
MPQFTGYFSGVKDAADMVRQKQADLDIHAERLQMMAMRNQDMAKQSQEMEQQKAEENLLKKSFGAKQTDANIQEDSNNKQSLVDKFMSAGQSMMEINPTKGIAMIKEAEALQQGKS